MHSPPETDPPGRRPLSAARFVWEQDGEERKGGYTVRLDEGSSAIFVKSLEGKEWFTGMRFPRGDV